MSIISMLLCNLFRYVKISYPFQRRISSSIFVKDSYCGVDYLWLELCATLLPAAMTLHVDLLPEQADEALDRAQVILELKHP